MFVDANEENLFFYFSNNVAKSCSYGLKISRNIKIKCLFHFKVYFNAVHTFQTSWLSAFKQGLISKIRAKTKRIKKPPFKPKGTLYFGLNNLPKKTAFLLFCGSEK